VLARAHVTKHLVRVLTHNSAAADRERDDGQSMRRSNLLSIANECWRLAVLMRVGGVGESLVSLGHGLAQSSVHVIGVAAVNPEPHLHIGFNEEVDLTRRQLDTVRV
jgi:hypothetical protein